MDLEPIFIIGFIVLGIYKVFELFVKRQERITLIEKLPLIINNNEENKNIDLPSISLGVTDRYGSWALRLSLLLIGIGLGCILALIMQVNMGEYFKNSKDWGYSRGEMLTLTNFACITFMGGLGLFVAYIIESKKESKSK